jgi:hypothetical protein
MSTSPCSGNVQIVLTGIPGVEWNVVGTTKQPTGLLIRSGLRVQESQCLRPCPQTCLQQQKRGRRARGPSLLVNVCESSQLKRLEAGQAAFEKILPKLRSA